MSACVMMGQGGIFIGNFVHNMLSPAGKNKINIWIMVGGVFVCGWVSV